MKDRLTVQQDNNAQNKAKLKPEIRKSPLIH